MKYKSLGLRIYLRVTFLFIVMCLAAHFIIVREYMYLLVLAPLILYLISELVKILVKTQQDLDQLVKASQYRDFSTNFDVKNAPAELQSLRRSLNEITTTFRTISREKETQYYYLQKILELVNTGILSYEMETDEVLWMNDSVKNLLQVPYLKTMKSLEKKDPQLYEVIQDLPPGQTCIATVKIEKGSFKALISATAFQTEEKRYKLIAFQNVNEALDETESKAWQKLLSVMTHEIMNSVAPISSLADTLKNRLIDTIVKGASEEDFKDMVAGFNTIQRRSEGLLKFAETYRNLNRITKLSLEEFLVEDMFSNLTQLMKPMLDQKHIKLLTDLKDPNLFLVADSNLMEQVMINLIVNAIEATKDQSDAHIILSAYLSSENRIVIKVSDNGKGIPEEIQGVIFIPFFSTKKNGSGIGLSLCKQIIMMHRATIQFKSQVGVGTSFYLEFTKQRLFQKVM